MIKVISRPFLGKEKYRNFRLCYVDSISETVYEQTPESKAWERTAPNPSYHKGKAELYAFFTEVALADQWGDDWDDAPYEHNAEEPYDNHYQGDERKEHLIIKVPFYVRHDWCDVKLPMDYGCGNSPFCVRDINAGAVAWVFARGLEEKSIDGIAIQAGVNPYEFFERVDKINELYPYVPEGNEDE